MKNLQELKGLVRMYLGDKDKYTKDEHIDYALQLAVGRLDLNDPAAAQFAAKIIINQLQRKGITNND